MKSTLYIPKKIRVGFQKREDCYLKTLAYIIYYDDKGVLRKETSWNGWRDKKIEPLEFDNVPTSGLILHKDIKRYDWGNHFGSKRTMIRVYDPRGMEFEITTENLLGVLMNADCSKRQLSGNYVYSWAGPELVLLPTSCEEYEKAASYTELQGKKISAKALKPGYIYKTKQEGEVTYIGHYFWYQVKYWRRSSSSSSSSRAGKKYHIFTDDDGKNFITKSSVEFLSVEVSTCEVSNFASLVETFQKNPHSSKIVKYEVVKCDIDFTDKSPWPHSAPELKRESYFSLTGNKLKEHNLYVQYETKYQSKTDKPNEYGYIFTLQGYKRHDCRSFDISTESAIYEESKSQYDYRSYHERYSTAAEISALDLGDLYVTLENGKRTKVNSLQEL